MTEKKSFDVLEHELVPKHEILSKPEADEVLRSFKSRAYQFPRIRESDPAARAIGAKVGDIVRVTRRHSPTAGQAIAYRTVVEG